MKLDHFTTAVFDMDGTLTDSMPQWRQKAIEYLKRLGVTLSDEEEQELRTLNGVDVAAWYMERCGKQLNRDELNGDCCRAMESVYREGVPMKPGALQFLQELKQGGICLILATATPAKLALMALNRLGLVRYFDYIVTQDMMGVSKGEPEFFRRLMQMTGAKEEETILFEDSIYAVTTAVSMGIRCVGISDATNVREEAALRRLSMCFISDFAELD